MRKSSSKMITRARSVRNIAKVPFKFKFDFLVESVENLAASGDVVVVWECNTNKVVSTKAVKINKTTRKASFDADKIASELTMYKTRPSDTTFQEKVFKLAVRANSADGKTLGKIHLNLAEYVEVPAGTKRISAELTNGSIIIATIQCQFISMGKQNAGKTEQPDSGELEDESESDDDASVCAEDAPVGFLKNRMKIGRGGSRKNIGRFEKKCRLAEGDSTEVVESLSDVEVVQMENTRLRKRLEEIGGGKMVEENRHLRKEVVGLKDILSREPVHVEVLRELKEAKMALAMLYMDKEMALFELMQKERNFE